jgi:hypothetical protein
VDGVDDSVLTSYYFYRRFLDNALIDSRKQLCNEMPVLGVNNAVLFTVLFTTFDKPNLQPYKYVQRLVVYRTILTALEID